MELSLKLRDDIIALLEFVQAKKASENVQFADSTAAKLCFGHGEFVTGLRTWDGGKGGPRLENVLKFERFLIDQLDKKEHAAFLKTRTRPTATAGTTQTGPVVDDWDD